MCYNLEIDADDSSDEESVTETIKNYNLVNKLYEFEAKAPRYIKQLHKYQYSFIAQAVGISLLYAHSVNQQYYRKKAKLPKTELLSSKGHLREWLHTTITRTISQVLKIDLQSTCTEKLTASLLENLDENIGKTVELLLRDQHQLFRQLNFDELHNSIEKCLTPFVEKVTKSIENLKTVPPFDKPKEFSARKLANNSGIQVYLLNNFAEEIAYLNENNLIQNNGKTLQKSTMIQKVDNIIENIDLEDREDVYKKTVLEIVKAGNSQNPTIKPDHHKAKLTELKLVSLFWAEEHREGSVLDLQSFMLNDSDTLRKYLIKFNTDWEQSSLGNMIQACRKEFKSFLPYTIQRLKKELIGKIEKDFNIQFLKQLKAVYRENRISLERGILPQQYLFISKNPIDHLTNLRKNNRVQTRQIRQAKEESQGRDIHEETFQRAWQFALPYQALEAQSISKNGYRTDLIENFDNYKNIYLEIEKFKKDINENSENQVGDMDFAYWILELLKGNTLNPLTNIAEEDITIDASIKKPLLKFLVNLTQMLFGTEVVRNPGSLVIHQMMLKLIEKGEMTWQQAFADNEKAEAFGGGIMPMSMEKKLQSHVVPCARALQQHYKFFTPLAYDYQGEPQAESEQGQEKIKELVNREIVIVEKWLNYFHPNETEIEEQANIIQKWCAECYGIKCLVPANEVQNDNKNTF